MRTADRDTDETNANAQTWLDRPVSLWEIKGVAKEDGWSVGWKCNGGEILVRNPVPEAKLGGWMELVDMFACYPGALMLHELVTERSDQLIPVLKVPVREVAAPLKALGVGSVDTTRRSREVCQTRPDRRSWNDRRGDIVVTGRGVWCGSYVGRPAPPPRWGQPGIKSVWVSRHRMGRSGLIRAAIDDDQTLYRHSIKKLGGSPRISGSLMKVWR
jgi:hypothetical protein